MLLELARLLSDDVRGLGVFEYITLRAVLACATALLIGLVAGPRVIRKLTEMKIGQAVQAVGQVHGVAGADNHGPRQRHESQHAQRIAH